ncbi:MAG: Gldg family protein [Pirellulales bacterium]|nr:Gldg family protein [Pirellulales bacterium]
MNTHVLYAVFKRNFVSYFANPTGYVFIFVFVLLSSAVTFWPADFFNNNLANLDQLSIYFPWIMLMFIPSITMGIWADERRQGTDELLLTIPAGDSDIVLGKFLASLAIYTVSLLFSLLCNFLVLNWLGNPDAGLFLGTYFGYWLIGMAMLAVGMVASFLTGNLTISYIFGAIFNAPLVVAAWAEMLLGGPAASFIKNFSIAGQLADFSRGVVSLAGVVYFATLTATMLYLCMVLIGRRHWLSGAAGAPMAGHYFVRVAALAVIAVGASIVVGRAASARIDVTAEGINSLSPETLKLLDGLNFKKPVQIEAFISPTVPEAYVQTAMNLRTILRELEARGKGMIRVDIHDTELLSKEAGLAEKKYGIEAKRVYVKEKGLLKPEKIYLNAVVSSGLQSVPPIFFDLGIPIEYELIRSLGTVSDLKKKRIGVLSTDAQLMGRSNFTNPMNPQSSPTWQVVAELQKQYEVVSIEPKMLVTDEKQYVKAAFDIDPADEEKVIEKGMELLKIDPADRKKLDAQRIAACKEKVHEEAESQIKIDALLAVQPSTLAPEDLERFVAAVAGGLPTAIFEDPFPGLAQGVPGTSPSWPKPTPGGMQAMMMGMRPSPKGDINPLWELLGAEIPGDDIIWQTYNPYPKAINLRQELVIVDQGEFSVDDEGKPLDDEAKKDAKNPLLPRSRAFNPQNEITAGLQQAIFPLPGAIVKRNASGMELTPLVITGRQTGTVKLLSLGRITPMGMQPANEPPRLVPTSIEYVLAAEIRGNKAAEKRDEKKIAEEKSDENGKKPAENKSAEKKTEEPKAAAPQKPIHAVLVSDIDLLTDELFYIRTLGRDNPTMDIKFDFDNVTFVLNILDELAGDKRFIEIRKRRPQYRTLERIEEQTREAKQRADKVREESMEKYEKYKAAAEAEVEKKIEDLRNRKEGDSSQMLVELVMTQNNEQQKLKRNLESLARERDQKIDECEREKEERVNHVRTAYKLTAVVLPPIFPLVVALGVFLYRRGREREGVARSRLR